MEVIGDPSEKPGHSLNWAPFDRDFSRGSGAALLFLGSESMTTGTSDCHRRSFVGSSRGGGGPTNRSDHSVQRSCQDIVSVWDNFDPTDHVNATALNQASPQVGRIATYEIDKSMKMSETGTEHRQYCVIKANTIH